MVPSSKRGKCKLYHHGKVLVVVKFIGAAKSQRRILTTMDLHHGSGKVHRRRRDAETQRRTGETDDELLSFALCKAFLFLMGNGKCEFDVLHRDIIASSSRARELPPTPFFACSVILARRIRVGALPQAAEINSINYCAFPNLGPCRLATGLRLASSAGSLPTSVAAFVNLVVGVPIREASRSAARGVGRAGVTRLRARN